MEVIIMGINIILSIASLIYCFLFVAICYHLFFIQKKKYNRIKKTIFYLINSISMTVILFILVLIILYTVIPYFSSYIFIFNISFWPLAAIGISIYLYKNLTNKTETCFKSKQRFILLEAIILLIIKIITLLLAILIFAGFCLIDKKTSILFPMLEGINESYTTSLLFKPIIIEFILFATILTWSIIKKIFFSKIVFSSYADIIFAFINTIIFLLLIISIDDYQENIIESLDVDDYSYLSWLLHGWMTLDYTNYMASPIIFSVVIILSQIINTSITIQKYKLYKKREKVKND